MHANEKKIYIDVIEMADHLQNHYRDYSGKKRGPFRALVRKAYDELSEMFANKSTPISTYNEDDDEDDEIDLEVIIAIIKFLHKLTIFFLVTVRYS